MPGDALRGDIGPDSPPGERLRLMEEFGMNDPWYQQYGRWVRNVLSGDLGRSFHYRRPGTEVIAMNMPNIAGRKNGRWPDKSIIFCTFVLSSFPTVLLAILMIYFFAFGTGWFPAMNAVDVRAAFAGGLPAFWSRLHHLILPAMTGALIGSTGIIYYLRSEVIDIQNSDFVTTARSKGVPENRVYTRHIFRNAMLPIAGGMGASIALVLSGSVFIESVFTFGGMGQLFITSLTARDWPVANALIMFYAIVGVVAGLLADLTIMIVDPRIRIK
jgi:peptide/nickel transport system permease protein